MNKYQYLVISCLNGCSDNEIRFPQAFEESFFNKIFFKVGFRHETMEIPC